ncbi:TIGR03792 family protein [Gloeocapsa sp. PCC 73106]|uniref:TIGR03792 family protein n=1 Tax=Gloeocapsa sp. PCC 73106 TaxID=102232 RepID=UPI0002AC66C0|nr:TIGR03792 family protein [Gloeocapsa sp. PCC 73106]ELR96773.1 putative cyanobacterial protein, TIGR03792 family [Gloeocapsa sp. PCC 73106]
MIIEWLKFEVTPEAKQKFIEADDDIYTETLATFPGYLGKETWLNPFVETEVILVIHWASREQWKGVAEDILLETEAKFAQAVGKDNYRIVESLEYQIRKFRQT